MNFKWSCGHSFEWSDKAYADYIRMGGYELGHPELGPCLDCKYPDRPGMPLAEDTEEVLLHPEAPTPLLGALVLEDYPHAIGGVHIGALAVPEFYGQN